MNVLFNVAIQQQTAIQEKARMSPSILHADQNARSTAIIL